MPQQIELRGRAASGGLFMGPIMRIGAASLRREPVGTPEAERHALETAIARAAEEISALMLGLEGDAQDVLAFQVAMLEDEALSGPAFVSIEKGVAADKAWAEALAIEIAAYQSSPDGYFEARAADLKDIRDRVLRNLSGFCKSAVPGGAILAGEDVAPTLFLETDWRRGGAIALTAGSPASHVAMLARARGVPMVVGLADDFFADHREAIVDGEAGTVLLSPGREARAAYGLTSADLACRRLAESRALEEPARTADGTRVEVLLNVAGLDDLTGLAPSSCDGIGLMRTEFLFRDGSPLPDEETQYQAYRAFLEWAGDRPVTIRTIDIGGDKPIRGLTPQGESNPFLGLRGIRLALARPDVFRVQLRALARAAVYGRLKIMIPMVTAPAELAQCRAMLDEVVAGLHREGVPCSAPPLGIMVEVPASAISPELFAEAAFFSIGSNDLTQYVTAAARDDAAVAMLNDPSHPAVLKLIANVVSCATDRGIPVSLCGDMAGEPMHSEALLGAGLRSLSVAPAALGRIKARIAEIRLTSSEDRRS